MNRGQRFWWEIVYERYPLDVKLAKHARWGVLPLNPPVKTGNPFTFRDDRAHYPPLTRATLEEFLTTTREMGPALQAQHFALHFPDSITEEEDTPSCTK